MRDLPQAAAALRTAVAPIAAYVSRTPPPNRHADHCAELVNAVADYVEAVTDTAPPEPDWQALTWRLFARFPYTPPLSPLIARIQAHLNQPHLQARAALPLAQRMSAARLTSHHLAVPDAY